MKRKLALLLAAAMTLSLLPTTSLFASSSNTLTGSSGNVSAKTVLVEHNLLPNNVGASSGNNSDPANGYVTVEGDLTNSVLRIGDNSNVSYVQGAPYLRIEPKSQITKDSQITLTLNGAEWFFVNGTTQWGKGNSDNAGTVDNSSLNRLNLYGGGTGTLYENTSKGALALTRANNNLISVKTLGTDNADNYFDPDYALEIIGMPPLSGAAFQPIGNAFNLQRSYRTLDENGDEVARFTATTGSNGSTYAGTYVRAKKGGDVTVATDIIYEMTVSSDGRTAYVRFPNPITGAGSSLQVAGASYDDPFAMDGDEYIYLPLITRTTASEDDVTVTINGNNTSISSGTYVLAGTTTGGTTTYVDDPKTARDEFPINLLLIKENRAGTLNNGTFEITAPSGFEFDEEALDGDFEIIAENFGWGATKRLDREGEDGVTNPDYTVSWKQARNEEDYSAIQIQLHTIGSNRSNVNGTPGTLVIKGNNSTDDRTNFRLHADDSVSFDTDVNLTVRNISTANTNITRQNDVKAGTRRDWTITLKTTGDIPTLINGRYFDDDAKDADDETHLAAEVNFIENVENAWWSGRVTTFTLPEGVKVRKVEFHDTDNLDAADEARLEGYYYNTNKKTSFVTVHENEITISGIKVEENTNGSLKRATLELDLWLSIESGFEGDIELAVSGSAIPEEVAPVVIAKAISPITLKAEVTPVQIGHQYFEVADITIQENVAGALEKDKEVWITVTDRIYQDMYFTPGYSVEVTEGNIKIKDKGIGSGNAIPVGSNKIRYGRTNGGSDLGSGTIVLDVDSISSTASTIKLSNLQLKIDRTVPESTAGYDVYAWGPNIAPNSDVFDYSGNVDDAYENNDLHNKLGIHTEYVAVTTPAKGEGSVLGSVVKVAVDNATAYRNGEAVTINPVAFIDGSSRLQVPVRALANLLGVTTEQIIWSDSDRTVTLNMPNRTIQFAIGSDIVLINGAQVRMDTEAMIKDDWTFIPFRALGEALGVVVSWDDATKTATFNADKE